MGAQGVQQPKTGVSGPDGCNILVRGVSICSGPRFDSFIGKHKSFGGRAKKFQAHRTHPLPAVVARAIHEGGEEDQEQALPSGKGSPCACVWSDRGRSLSKDQRFPVKLPKSVPDNSKLIVGWPKHRLAPAFLWEHRCKRLKLTQRYCWTSLVSFSLLGATMHDDEGSFLR